MSVVKTITEQSVKDNVLLELWVLFAAWASLKEFAKHAGPEKLCV